MNAETHLWGCRLLCANPTVPNVKWGLVTVGHRCAPAKWPAEFGRPFQQTFISQELTERATGLEPATSSLGSRAKLTSAVTNGDRRQASASGGRHAQGDLNADLAAGTPLTFITLTPDRYRITRH